MSQLPHGLTEPLHILGPSPWPLRLLIGGLLLLALLAWILRSRRRDAEPPLEKASPVPPSPPAGDLLSVLEALRRRVLESKSYREGCHQLSALLREHLAKSEGRPYPCMTAREIGEWSSSVPWVSLLSLVAELQFQRRSPRRGDFDGVCDLARDVASGSAGGKR